MKRMHRHLTRGSILAGGLVLTVAPFVAPVQAHSAAIADQCSSPLPAQLAFTGGGRNTTVYTLHSQSGALLTFTRYAGAGLNNDLHTFGYRALSGDVVGEFEVVTPSNIHVYAGPIHLFRHGGRQHVCRAGGIGVNASGSTTQQANRYRINVRIEGWLDGRHAQAIVWVGSKRFAFTGTQTH